MAIFKCKMCGGTIEFNPGDTVGVCDSCGSRQTLPRLDDEKKANLYDRANHFRRNNDYDKAMGIYEQILNEDSTDAEAYWSLVLCRYGIEYVEDPATHKRVPTVNRAQYTSIFSDEDYKSALQYADSYQRVIYEDEAKAIDDIQKGILEISQKEAPFDVFICYKETDNNGRRTMDSVLANDLYHQLTQEGFKVFFSRITLEDKLGTAYEPYIFAALNSAKVMVVLGTKPEYFNAVWVKNEWSRYLALVRKSGGKKVLIPAYKDMDPYDLPEEFSHLQAQDMSKLGFMQDLIRGIKKITAVNAPKQPVKETVVVQQGGVNTTVSAQVQRGSMALEDREWAKADSFFEEALNLDPHCAEAYIGKMLARDQMPSFDAWVETQKDKYAAQPAEGETLIACPEDSEHIDKKIAEMTIPGYLEKDDIRKLYVYYRGYYSILSERRNQKEAQLQELAADRLLARGKQYAEGDTRKRIETGLAAITESLDQRIEEARKVDERSIAKVTAAYTSHLTEADKKAVNLYQVLSNCREQKYQSAVEEMRNAHYHYAQNIFLDLKSYKDSTSLAEQCEKLLEERKEANKAAERQAIQKRDKIIAILILILAYIAAVYALVTKVIIPNNKYNAAVSLMNEGKYDEAIVAFEALDSYKDSNDKIKDSNYLIALSLMNEGKYDEAAVKFEKLRGHKDSKTLAKDCKYNVAVALMSEGKYDEAAAKFEKLKGHKDSETLAKDCKYSSAIEHINSGDYDSAYDLLEKIGKTDEIASNKYERAMAYINSGDYDAGYALLREIGKSDEIASNKYDRAMAYINSGDYDAAYALLEGLQYKDSKEKVIDKFLNDHPEYKLKLAQVGDVVKFGTYEQDNDISNGKEYIEWLVLAKENNRLLVISKHILDWQGYHTSSDTYVTWATCTLRTWLNETFLNAAFSSIEQAAIVQTTVTADRNPDYYTYSNQGNPTTDKVFLLSIAEANKFFSSDNARQCKPTAFAIANGATVESDGYSWWSLRSLGKCWIYYSDKEMRSTYVSPQGEVINFGSNTDLNKGIRPAMWIDLEKI